MSWFTLDNFKTIHTNGIVLVRQPDFEFFKTVKKLRDDVTFFLFTFVWIQIEVGNLSIMSETADDSEKIESQDDDKWKGIASSEKTRGKIKFITDF